MNPVLEAVGMERNLTLLAHKQGLAILLALQAALLAVVPGGLPVLVRLGGANSMVQTIKPRVISL
jgi:hypothetical protein